MHAWNWKWWYKLVFIVQLCDVHRHLIFEGRPTHTHAHIFLQPKCTKWNGKRNRQSEKSALQQPHCITAYMPWELIWLDVNCLDEKQLFCGYIIFFFFASFFVCCSVGCFVSIPIKNRFCLHAMKRWRTIKVSLAFAFFSFFFSCFVV